MLSFTEKLTSDEVVAIFGNSFRKLQATINELENSLKDDEANIAHLKHLGGFPDSIKRISNNKKNKELNLQLLMDYKIQIEPELKPQSTYSPSRAHSRQRSLSQGDKPLGDSLGFQKKPKK